MLSLENVWRGKPQPAEDRFRVVLCWLENDPDGDNMRNVAQAFTSIEGVTLVRSADIVAASGAADDWREAMQREGSFSAGKAGMPTWPLSVWSSSPERH